MLFLSHDQDNHDGVITHLELDILQCEVKWALGSITTNKASGGDGIPVELFEDRKSVVEGRGKGLEKLIREVGWTKRSSQPR